LNSSLWLVNTQIKCYGNPQNVDAVIYLGTAFDLGMAVKAQAINLMPHFKRINSEVGIKKCIELINDDFNSIEESTNFWRMSVIPLAKDLRDIFFHKSEYELTEQPCYPSKASAPPDDEQKSIIHRQKLRECGVIYNDFYQYLRKIDKPSILLMGYYDPLNGVYERSCFLSNAPNGIVFEFKNSCHFPHLEEPQAFTDAIVDFMSNLTE
jgi:pimeloyl-ACP methyl ester carboxylesterase